MNKTSLSRHSPRKSQRLAAWATRLSGSSWAFLVMASMTALWLMTGPLFGFSPGWQAVMSIVSSLATFLMVFRLSNKP